MDRHIGHISIHDLLQKVPITRASETGEYVQLSFLLADVSVHIEVCACKIVDAFRQLPVKMQTAIVKSLLEKVPKDGDFAALREDIFWGEMLYVTRLPGNEKNVRLRIKP